jgi:hypothetical protein
MEAHDLTPCATCYTVDGRGQFWIRCSCGWNSKFVSFNRWNVPQNDHWKAARRHWAEVVSPTRQEQFLMVRATQMRLFEEANAGQ